MPHKTDGLLLLRQIMSDRKQESITRDELELIICAIFAYENTSIGEVDVAKTADLARENAYRAQSQPNARRFVQV